MNPASILGIIITLFEETQRLVIRIGELEQELHNCKSDAEYEASKRSSES